MLSPYLELSQEVSHHLLVFSAPLGLEGGRVGSRIVIRGRVQCRPGVTEDSLRAQVYGSLLQGVWVCMVSPSPKTLSLAE